MTAEPLIRFRGVGKTYPKTDLPVLEDINLEVQEGSLVAIIGPSGCGKSTLLNLLAGLTEVTSGSIELARADLTSAYVFQGPRLLPWRKVQANVEFSLEQIGIGAAERRERARAALELVHLEEHGDKYPHQLSGGMQQRVALARGLALEPTLLLMDEPFGALDALTRGYLQEELLQIVRRNATTTMLVTHDIDEALLLADQVVVMSSRPARIRAVFDVPFGRERDFDQTIADPAFVPLRHEIRSLLRPELAASDSTIGAQIASAEDSS
ncbi:MAG: ABC transporter ATP-binding protein [Candidatus Leucobacter sulfamidivorax]|nr:ABC transporter ATP-binding protein [Candidatus Leucobacter sulfamidivorax]